MPRSFLDSSLLCSAKSYYSIDDLSRHLDRFTACLFWYVRVSSLPESTVDLFKAENGLPNRIWRDISRTLAGVELVRNSEVSLPCTATRGRECILSRYRFIVIMSFDKRASCGEVQAYRVLSTANFDGGHNYNKFQK